MFIMGWRAVVRVELQNSAWTWTKLCGVLGAVTFAISDFLIGIDYSSYTVCVLLYPGAILSCTTWHRVSSA